MLSRVTRVTAISIEFHFAQSRKEVCRLQGALYTRLQSPNTFITLFGFYEANKQPNPSQLPACMPQSKTAASDLGPPGGPCNKASLDGRHSARRSALHGSKRPQHSAQRRALQGLGA